MAFDLILRNARFKPGGGESEVVDIALSEGRIAAIAPRLAAATDSVDAQGRFVSTGLVESHFHLDKSRILDRVAALEDRRATDYMKRTSAVKAYVHGRRRLQAGERDARAMPAERRHAHAHACRSRSQRRAARARSDRASREGFRVGHRPPDLRVPAGGLDPCSRSRGEHRRERSNAARLRSAARRDTTPTARLRSDASSRSAKEFDVDVDIHLDGGYTTDDMISARSVT